MDSTKVVLQHGSHELKMSGVVMKIQGFLEVAEWMRSEDKPLDPMQKGISAKITETVLDESRLRLIKDGLLPQIF